MEYDGDVDDFVRRGIDDIASKYAQLGAQWQKEREFTHIEPTDDRYQAAIHYMQDCQEVDDFARRGIMWIAERYFIQGAKWREKQYLVSKDMEIAFKEYAKREHCECDLETSGEPIQYDSTNDLIDACRYGALLQKEQMMKGAIEGNVCGRVIDHINVRVEGYNALTPSNITHIPCERKNFHKFKIGDKVKVIIIKD